MRNSSLCRPTLPVGAFVGQGASVAEALYASGSARRAYLDCFLEHFKVAR
jgi:hypothetical protein